LAVSKNSINSPIKTESIFSTEPINIQSLNCSNVNCSFLDTIAKQPTNGGAIGTTGFRYTIYSFPFEEIKDNSCEIHYYQIISLSGVDNIPLVFSKKNGKVQINNNVLNSKCSNLKLVKDPMSDSYNFENKPIHPIIRVYTNKLELEVETFTGGAVKKLIIH
jgi:hypothetical protein